MGTIEGIGAIASRKTTSVAQLAEKEPAPPSSLPEPRSILLDRAEVLHKLRRHIRDKHSTSSAAATVWNCTPAFVSSVLKRVRPPTKVMLDELGYARIEVFAPLSSLPEAPAEPKSLPKMNKSTVAAKKSNFGRSTAKNYTKRTGKSS